SASMSKFPPTGGGCGAHSSPFRRLSFRVRGFGCALGFGSRCSVGVGYGYSRKILLASAFDVERPFYLELELPLHFFLFSDISN
uniref:Uncharacterized protein n=1 Tax=Hippocampus comes TaxID=109280 RepID=A0A3Q2Z6K7_HIPCM